MSDGLWSVFGVRSTVGRYCAQIMAKLESSLWPVHRLDGQTREGSQPWKLIPALAVGLPSKRHDCPTSTQLLSACPMPQTQSHLGFSLGVEAHKISPHGYKFTPTLAFPLRCGLARSGTPHNAMCARRLSPIGSGSQAEASQNRARQQQQSTLHIMQYLPLPEPLTIRQTNISCTASIVGAPAEYEARSHGPKRARHPASPPARQNMAFSSVTRCGGLCRFRHITISPLALWHEGAIGALLVLSSRLPLCAPPITSA